MKLFNNKEQVFEYFNIEKWKNIKKESSFYNVGMAFSVLLFIVSIICSTVSFVMLLHYIKELDQQWKEILGFNTPLIAMFFLFYIVDKISLHRNKPFNDKVSKLDSTDLKSIIDIFSIKKLNAIKYKKLILDFETNKKDMPETLFKILKEEHDTYLLNQTSQDEVKIISKFENKPLSSYKTKEEIEEKFNFMS